MRHFICSDTLTVIQTCQLGRHCKFAWRLSECSGIFCNDLHAYASVLGLRADRGGTCSAALQDCQLRNHSQPRTAVSHGTAGSLPGRHDTSPGLGSISEHTNSRVCTALMHAHPARLKMTAAPRSLAAEAMSLPVPSHGLQAAQRAVMLEAAAHRPCQPASWPRHFPPAVLLAVVLTAAARLRPCPQLECAHSELDLAVSSRP